jgi:FixJ family two-component response regulator
MDGADAASLALTLDERIPIVVSGYLTPDLEGQLREMGIRHFVKKPFRTAQLLETVEEALREHQQTET